MIVMGRVRAPFGVKGWIKVQPYTQTTQGLLAYPQWCLREEGSWQWRTVAEAAVHGNSLLARLDGCTDRDEAARLKGREIAVPRDWLPATAPGEFYWADLIGRVEGLLETGAGAVLAVRDDARRLLPFAQTVIREVDRDAGRIVVDWERDY
jgi:16S rRNA processing protein RimM